MPSSRDRILHALARIPGLLRTSLKLRGQLTSELDVVIDSIHRGDVVFDVGANLGYLTQFFSALTGSGGRVYAFEPVPPTFVALSERMAARRVTPNVELIQAALAERSGTAVMHLPGEDYGQASLKPHLANGSWVTTEQRETFDCKLIRLDDFVSERGITRIDFLKCDVEGAELLVLQGGSDTLRRLRPVLYLEVCPDWTSSFGYHPTDVMQFLNGMGYENFKLVGTGHGPPIQIDLPGLAKLSGSANLLCIPTL